MHELWTLYSRLYLLVASDCLLVTYCSPLTAYHLPLTTYHVLPTSYLLPLFREDERLLQPVCRRDSLALTAPWRSMRRPHALAIHSPPFDWSHTPRWRCIVHRGLATTLLLLWEVQLDSIGVHSSCDLSQREVGLANCTAHSPHSRMRARRAAAPEE